VAQRGLDEADVDAATSIRVVWEQFRINAALPERINAPSYLDSLAGFAQRPAFVPQDGLGS
jgi:hypothetical protein